MIAMIVVIAALHLAGMIVTGTLNANAVDPSRLAAMIVTGRGRGMRGAVCLRHETRKGMGMVARIGRGRRGTIGVKTIGRGETTESEGIRAKTSPSTRSSPIALSP